MSRCGCCEDFRPQWPCPPTPPPESCCTKCFEAEICCHKCKHKSKFTVKLPAFKNVYLNARLAGPITLTPAVASLLGFNAIVSISDPCIYNLATGLLTVPVCGQGVYTLSTNMTLTAPVTPSIFTVSINVNGTPIDTITATLAAGTTQDVALPVAAYPLQLGQSVSVTVTGSTGGTVSSAYFSLVRSSDL